MAETILSASKELIHSAFFSCSRGREFWPDPFAYPDYWVEWWTGAGSNMMIDPMAVTERGEVVALLAITDYRAEHNTAELHYCAGRIHNPTSVYRKVNAIMRWLELDERLTILYGHHNLSDKIITRTTELFGFKPFAKSGGICYTARQMKRGN